VPAGVRIAPSADQPREAAASRRATSCSTERRARDLERAAQADDLEQRGSRSWCCGARQVALEATPSERPMVVEGGTETHWGIGVSLGPTDEGAEYRDEVVRNPLVALGRGVERTGEILVMIVGGIAQLVTGHVGMSSLSGPIGIGEIAADAYQTSWEQFVWLMAVISVNLAILNLLPIPVLDGGQIVLAAAEGIKGSPLPARARDVAQTVGLSLILLLMGVAFWNDIARHWSGVVQFFSTLG
jgi:membrane-associated protease RseP (regulator of RpoE activity)